MQEEYLRSYMAGCLLRSARELGQAREELIDWEYQIISQGKQVRDAFIFRKWRLGS